MSEDESSPFWCIGVEDIIYEMSGHDRSICSGERDWRELSMLRQQRVKDPTLAVLRQLDQELVDFREVGFGSDTTVVEQAIMKGISVFISEGLCSSVAVKFQTLLVVVLKS